MSALPAPTSGYPSVEVDGYTLVHDPRRGQLHVLNATGGIVWRACVGGLEPAHLVAEVAPDDSFASLIEADVEAFVGRLIDGGLLNGEPWVPDAPGESPPSLSSCEVRDARS